MSRREMCPIQPGNNHQCAWAALLHVAVRKARAVLRYPNDDDWYSGCRAPSSRGEYRIFAPSPYKRLKCNAWGQGLPWKLDGSRNEKSTPSQNDSGTQGDRLISERSRSRTRAGASTLTDRQMASATKMNLRKSTSQAEHPCCRCFSNVSFSESS